jgi:hypothetical protein
LEVLKVPGLQSIGQTIIQSIHKIILLLLIRINFLKSIAIQLSELGDILIHRYGSLSQILKLLPLPLDQSLGNMMCMESSSEFQLVDTLGFHMGFHVSIPLVGYRTRNLVRG